MRLVILCISFVTVTALANDLMVTQIVDRSIGLDATAIIIAAADNCDFKLIDVPIKKNGDDIREHWQTNYVLMINGGYFNADFTPTGLCRIGGRTLSAKQSDRLSGFVALDESGQVHLFRRDDDVSEYPDVIQCGPYVIDPGGGIGIHKNDGVRAERTLIGMTEDGRLIILVTKPVTLYDLARSINASLPEVDRLLNLDGGPSTSVKTSQVERKNQWPVRNYIAKEKSANKRMVPTD